jgi:hypothetical protein
LIRLTARSVAQCRIVIRLFEPGAADACRGALRVQDEKKAKAPTGGQGFG